MSGPSSKPVRHRVDGANRAVLLVLALLLIAAGVIALLVGFGSFFLKPGSAVLPGSATGWVADRPWLWWVAAAVALVVALLALRWLIAQLTTDGVGSIDLTRGSGHDGTIQVRSAGITEAVEDDAESILGVERASARVAGHDAHRVELTVVLSADADISQVRRDLEERTVAHLRQALDDPSMPVQLDLKPSARAVSSRSLR